MKLLRYRVNVCRLKPYYGKLLVPSENVTVDGPVNSDEFDNDQSKSTPITATTDSTTTIDTSTPVVAGKPATQTDSDF